MGVRPPWGEMKGDSKREDGMPLAAPHGGRTMGKKGKKLIVWQEEQKPAEKPRREDIEKAFAKPKSKRPLITSSHKGGA